MTAETRADAGCAIQGPPDGSETALGMEDVTAPPPGFEPGPSEPKSEVLPLHHGGQAPILTRPAPTPCRASVRDRRHAPCRTTGPCGNATSMRGTLARVLGVDLTLKTTRPADPIGGFTA